MASASFLSPLASTTDPNLHMKPNHVSKNARVWIALLVSITFFILASVATYCYRKARQELRQRQQQHQQHVNEVVAILPRRIHQAAAGETEEEQLACSICLEEFQDQEELVELPGCMHLFHDECIGKWLRRRGECPICRGGV